MNPVSSSLSLCTSTFSSTVPANPEVEISLGSKDALPVLPKEVMVELIQLLTKPIPLKDKKGELKDVYFTIAELYAYLHVRKSFKKVLIVGSTVFYLMRCMPTRILRNFGVENPEEVFTPEVRRTFDVKPSDLDIKFYPLDSNEKSISEISTLIMEFCVNKLQLPQASFKDKMKFVHNNCFLKFHKQFEGKNKPRNGSSRR